MDVHRYKVGEVVRWLSQGWDGEREGRVVAVVPAGRSAYAYVPEGTYMSDLRGAPMSLRDDRYLVVVTADVAPGARPFYLLPSCTSIDTPHKRQRRRGASARARERVEALQKVHQDRTVAPRGRYAVRCG